MKGPTSRKEREKWGTPVFSLARYTLRGRCGAPGDPGKLPNPWVMDVQPAKPTFAQCTNIYKNYQDQIYDIDYDKDLAVLGTLLSLMEGKWPAKTGGGILGGLTSKEYTKQQQSLINQGTQALNTAGCTSDFRGTCTFRNRVGKNGNRMGREERDRELRSAPEAQSVACDSCRACGRLVIHVP